MEIFGSLIESLKGIITDATVCCDLFGGGDGKEYAYDADSGRWITVHPNGASEGKGRRIHLDENGRVDSEGPLADAIRAKEGNRADSGVRKSISNVYTGSAANYDEPSLIHVGSGEGSQVYGWGLYGSTVRDVAEGYARSTNKGDERQVYFKGKPVSGEEDTVESTAALFFREAKGNVDKAIKDLEFDIKCNENNARVLQREPDEITQNRLRSAIEVLRENGSDFSYEKSGYGGENVYEQTFFTNRAEGDESHLINWYKSIGSRKAKLIGSQLVKEGWVKEGETAGHFVGTQKTYYTSISTFKKTVDGTDVEIHLFDSMEGRDLYDELSKWPNTPKAASEFLARADIDGIKYPVDSYGGKTVKDGDKVGWNYVSFRDDNINVDHKWVDGQEVPVANESNRTKAMVSILKDFVPGIDVGEVDEDEVTKELGDEKNDVGFQFSLVGIREDGTEVYETPKEIKKMGDSQRSKLFKESLVSNEVLPIDIVHENGELKLGTTSKGRHHITRNHRGMSFAGFAAKLKTGASGDIYDILSGAKFVGEGKQTEERKAHHPDVKQWLYFEKTVEVDGRVFDVIANVARKDDGDFLYDAYFRRHDMTVSPVDRQIALPDKTTEGGHSSCRPTSNEIEVSNGRILEPETLRGSEEGLFGNHSTETPNSISKGLTSRQGGVRHSLIIGEGGASRLAENENVQALQNLKVAKEMLGEADWEKMTRDEKVKIKAATGWEKGKDGKWRRESLDIPDQDYKAILGKLTETYKKMREEWKRKSNFYDHILLDANATEQEIHEAKEDLDNAKNNLNGFFGVNCFVPSTLKAVLGENHEVIKAYPELADMDVRLIRADGLSTRGTMRYENGRPFVEVASGLLLFPEQLKNTLTHEIQHVIQHEEGFGSGGNLELGRTIENAEEEEWNKRRHQINVETWKDQDELNAMIEAAGKKDELSQIIPNAIKNKIPRAVWQKQRDDILDAIPGYREKEKEITARIKKREDEFAPLTEARARRSRMRFGDIQLPGTTGYRRISGEVEARNAGGRTESDRNTIGKELLEDTEDIAREDQVVVNDARKAMECEYAFAKAGTAKQPIRGMNGKVAGWYDRNTGKVRLVKGVATPATVAHEIGWHATFHWAEKHHPELHKKLLQYAKEAPEGIEQSVKAKYGTNLTPNELLDEIGAERFTREDISPLLQEAQKRASEQFFDRVENEQDNLRKAFVEANSVLSREELDEIAQQEPKKAVEMLVRKMLEGRKVANDSACCDLWGGPYEISAEAEDAMAMDVYELKENERWITTKKGHHVVINTETKEIVYGNKNLLRAIAGSKNPELVETLNSIKEEVEKGEYADASPELIAMFERVRDNKETIRKLQREMLAWGDLSKTEKWRNVVDGLKGADLYTARNAVNQLMDKLTPRMFAALPASGKERVAEQCMGLIGAFLHNFGGAELPKGVVSRAQKTIGDSVPSIKGKWPEFFADNFYDSVVGYYNKQKQMEIDRSRNIQNLVKKAEAVISDDEAKEVQAELTTAMEQYGDMDALRTAKKRVDAIIAGGERSEGRGKRGFSAMVNPTFPNSLDELVELQAPASFAKGYTKPRLFADRNGKKWVLKDGGSEGHALAEHEASEAYRKLGIPAPASKMYGNQRLAEYIEGKELGQYLATATPEERQRVVAELRRGFAADVMLGNHDLIGDDEDNVMVGEDGRVWRVDNGGALGKKGAGEDDASFDDGWVDDIWTMRGKSPRIDGDTRGMPNNPQLKKYFGSVDTHELLQQAAAMPWKQVIAAMGEGKRKEVMKQRVAEMQALAATSKGVVEDGKYLPDYNEDILRMTYALSKTPFRELAGHKSKQGIPMLYDATTAGFVRQPITGSFKTFHTKTNADSPKVMTVNEQSLGSIVERTAEQVGIDLSRTDEMFADQGVSTSMGTSANKLKVMELVGMGYTLSQIADGNVADLSRHIKRRVANAAKDYLAHGGVDGRDFRADMAAMKLRKAATMLFFQHANLPNYDPRTQRLLCVRTESDGVINSHIRQHQGEVLPAYPRDSHASYSWFQTCTPTDNDNLIAVSVPISRISSCDLFANTKGENLFNRLHRQESEVGVNAFGLPFIYLGRTEQMIPIRDYFKKIAKAERDSGKTLAGEVLRNEGDYLRLSAPWAREAEG